MSTKQEFDASDVAENLCLASRKNRFSNRVLDSEKVNDASTLGFRKFMAINRSASANWWTTKYDRIKLEMLPEEKVRTQESDALHGLRCKRFLVGEDCSASCSFMHKYPKEDKVLCARMDHHDHASCIYYHVEQVNKFKDSKVGIKKLKDESRSTSSPVSRMSPKGQSSPLAPKTEATPVKKEKVDEADSRSGSASISSSNGSTPKPNLIKPDPSPKKSATKPDPSPQKPTVPQATPPVVRVKSEPMDIDEAPVSAARNGSVPAFGSRTPTARENLPIKIKPITSLCGSPIPPPPSIKPEKPSPRGIVKPESTYTNNSNLITIKTEPIETMEHEISPFGSSVNANSTVTENGSGKRVRETLEDPYAHPVAKKPLIAVAPSNGLPPVKREASGTVASGGAASDRRLVVRPPPDYKLPAEKILTTVTKYIFSYIDTNDPQFRNDLKRRDDYEALCQYLAKNQVQLLSEIEHGKNLLWDVYVRYCLINLQSRIKIYDYTKLIENSFKQSVMDLFRQFNEYTQRKTGK